MHEGTANRQSMQDLHSQMLKLESEKLEFKQFRHGLSISEDRPQVIIPDEKCILPVNLTLTLPNSIYDSNMTNSFYDYVAAQTK